jgi:hypothetical protein
MTAVPLSLISKDRKMHLKRNIRLKISKFQKGKLQGVFKAEKEGTVHEYRRLDDGWWHSTWKSSHSPSCFNPPVASDKSVD